MRRLFLSIIMVVWCCIVSGQQTDMIVLKNSEVVRGVITSIDTLQGVSILMMPDSIIRIVLHSEISRVIYKKSDSKSRLKYRPRDAEGNIIYKPLKRNSYQAFIRLGAGWGENSETESYSFLKADFINGVSFDGVMSVGIGFGVRLGENKHTLVPVFIDLRSAPLKGRFSPMIAVSGGVNFQSDMDWDFRGVYLNPEIGFRIGRPTSTFVVFAIGLERFDFFSFQKSPYFTGQITENNYLGWTCGVMLGF